MDKKEYQKAYELILRGYDKEPDNPGISYYHSKLLFEKTYSGYNLDSARITVEVAKKKFENASDEIIDELNDELITFDTINSLHEAIRDQVYQNLLTDLTIPGADLFQAQFPNSIYESKLIYKVDSIEYGLALGNSTEDTWVQFIGEHPNSIFVAQADSILDHIRYHKLSTSGDLKAYYAFFTKYPQTRFKKQLEEFILKTSTASHSEKSYLDFIRLATTPELKKKAADVLYYLSQKKNYREHPKSDSIQEAKSSMQTELYPVIKNGKYGFYDRAGNQQIDHLFQEIAEDYKCQLILDDWIYVEDSESGLTVTNRGIPVLKGIDGYRSVSEDVALVEKNELWYLYHKSGFSIIDEPIDEAELISNKWIKVKKGEHWGLISMMGLTVAEVKYDDIYKLESFWIFKKNKRIAVYTEDLIMEEIEDRGVSLEFKFDDIEVVDKNLLIGFRGGRECLLDSTLSFQIPWGEYEIYPESSGWYLKSDQGYQLYNFTEGQIMDQRYSYLESNDGWLALKAAGEWILLSQQENLEPVRQQDSVRLINDFAALLLKESQRELLFLSGEKIDVTDKQIQTFPNGFISMSDGETTALINQSGETVTSGKFEKTIFLNDTLIRAQVRGKQGLVDINGEWILNPVFDTIDEKDGLILTLIKGKIGCYDPLINTLITTGYETRLKQIGDYYLTKKDGKFGVIDRAKAEVISFKYDEISQWNDTSYLVRIGDQHMIIDPLEKPILEAIESLVILNSNEIHDIYRFVKDGKYGLISTQYGEILTPDYTDIFNIGSAKSPLIFADQHLDKARFHVVSYVDERGKLIHSKAYTREEFDGILCDE